MAKKILITGANGLIGRSLYQHLKHSRDEIYAVDNNSRFSTYTQDGVTNQPLEEFLQNCNIGFDYIIHLAAINGTSNFYSRPLDVISNNVKSDLSVFDYAQQHNCKILYASSSEVVSESSNIPTSEEIDVTVKDIHNPRWSYKFGKMIGENYLMNSKLDYVIIRFFNLFSEHSGKGHFVHDIVQKIKQNNFELIGPFETRSFCYVTDVVPHFLPIMHKINKEILNLGSDEEIKIIEAANIICHKFKVKPNWKFKDSLPGSCQRRCPDLSKIKSIIPDYNPRKFAQIIDQIFDKF